VRVASALRSANDDATWIETYFDNFGRPVREVRNGIETRTDYDGAERVWRISHPSTTGNYLYTENRYDSGGRQTQTVRPDGKIVTTSYDRNSTLVTDEADVAGRSTVDGLGRLVAVTEDPAGLNYTTRYAYDANDSLLTVCPHGGTLSGSVCSGSDRRRLFSYDRLGRLKTVQNPEAAQIEYYYDETASTQGKGNLTRKVQQRGLSGALVSGEVRYHYDEWNRPVSRVYSGVVNGVTTPKVTYRYDTHEYPVSGVTSYPKGRLTGVKSGGVEVALDSMDAQGRVTRSRQVTDGVTYRFGTDTLPGYEYFRQGALARMRYPSGREVIYTVDDQGRSVTADGLLAGQGTNYVQSVQYTAFGAVAEMRLNGGVLRERYGYSAQRLQMEGVDVERCATVGCGSAEELLHLEYAYGNKNNGNPREQVIRSAGMNVRQRYEFDGLNRLRQFREEPAGGGAAALTEDYCYDRHGNRGVLARAGLLSQTPQVAACTEEQVLGLFPGTGLRGRCMTRAGSWAAMGGMRCALIWRGG